MKTLNRKTISVTLSITLGSVFSINANAAQTTNLENSISEMVIAQGQRVMSDLTVQLQQSITEEINKFSIDFSFDESITESLAWLREESTTAIVDDTKESEQIEESSTTEIKFLK